MTISTGNAYIDSMNKTAAASAAKASKSNQNIDQSGFLKLLTTQMTTQDPTAPTDNAQMVQQMATFSQLSGITEMNGSLKSMATDIAASRFGDASGWIGRAALVDSNIAVPAGNGAYAGEITLPTDARGVTLSLLDASGNAVHTETMGAKSAGAVSWSWDGKDAAGKAVPGPLRMSVTAAAANGTGSVDATLAAWTEVASVQSPVSGATKLITGLGSFAPSDVQALS